MRTVLFLAFTRKIPFLASRTLRPVGGTPLLAIGVVGQVARFSSKRRDLPFVPSAEQEAIVSAVKSSRNVVVDAVAGSGKTATIKYIAEKSPDKRVRVVTYNKKLMSDTAAYLEPNKNASVHTFHGFVTQMYKIPCPDDSILNAYVEGRSNFERRETIPATDILIIDEAQDLTPLLYKLVVTICHDLNSSPQLVILGDRDQAIYQFRGSDGRYLTLAEKLFSPVNSLRWEHLRLRTSYRLSTQTAECINGAFLRTDKMQGFASGEPPKYIATNTGQLTPEILDILVKQIKKYGAGNTMVLAHSLMNNWDTIKFERSLVYQHRIPVYVSVGEERALNPRASAGKVVFSTFHQAKGRQADLAIVFGVDNRMPHGLGPNACPNMLYVALTRAKKQLVMLQKVGKTKLRRPILPLPFVDLDTLRATTSEDSIIPVKPHPSDCYPYEPYSKKKVTVKELLGYQRFEVIDKAVAQIEITSLQNPLSAEENQIMTKIPGVHKTEDVTDLTGAAMHLHCELTLGPTPSGARSSKPQAPLTVSNLLEHVTKTNSRGSYHGRWQQLLRKNGFDWVGEDSLRAACMDRIRGVIGTQPTHLQFEKSYERCIKDLTDGDNSMPGVINGRVDLLRGGEEATLFEFKFTERLQSVHILQLALYGWLYEEETGSRSELRLFNIKTGELLKIELPPKEKMRNLVRELLDSKSRPAKELTDDEFIQAAIGSIKKTKKE